MRIKDGSTEHKVLKAISLYQPPRADYYSREALEALKKLGLVTPDNKITDQGTAALSRIKLHGRWDSPLGT